MVIRNFSCVCIIISNNIEENALFSYAILFMSNSQGKQKIPNFQFGYFVVNNVGFIVPFLNII